MKSFWVQSYIPQRRVEGESATVDGNIVLQMGPTVSMIKILS